MVGIVVIWSVLCLCICWIVSGVIVLSLLMGVNRLLSFLCVSGVRNLIIV